MGLGGAVCILVWVGCWRALLLCGVGAGWGLVGFGISLLDWWFVGCVACWGGCGVFLRISLLCGVDIT